MIRRDIKNHTEEVLKSFDYFNDYKDTRFWARRNFPDVIPALDAGYERHVEMYARRMDERITEKHLVKE